MVHKKIYKKGYDMSKKTIVVCDHIHQSGLDILANDSEIELINAADLNLTVYGEDKTGMVPSLKTKSLG